MQIYGLTGRRLLVHPQPLHDELLTHWLWRLAAANGLKIQTLASLAFGGQSSFWARDPDKHPSQLAIQRFAELSGREENEILDLTLVSYDGLYSEASTGKSKGMSSWILPVGIYHRTRRLYGMQFCPLCLATDPIPYFRRKWRLAFSTFCDRHGTMLHDRCPECGVPIVWIRNDIGQGRCFQAEHSFCCWKCSFDLRRAAALGPRAIDGESIAALRSLIMLHDLGWWFVEDETISYAHLYFSALRHVVGWLSSRRGSLLLDSVMPDGWKVQVKYKQAFECRPISERHHLLVIAHWLLQDWPHRFVDAAKSVGITQGAFLHQPLPYWFAGEIQVSLGAEFYQPSETEAANAVAYLQKRGEKITPANLAGLLGSLHCAEVQKFVVHHPPPLTEEEFHAGMLKLSMARRKCRTGKRERYSLWRDTALFSLAWFEGKLIPQVLAMSVMDGAVIAMQSCVRTKSGQQAIAILKLYLKYARPKLTNGNEAGALFPSGAHGRPLCEEGWRKRWRSVFGSRGLPARIADSGLS